MKALVHRPPRADTKNQECPSAEDGGAMSVRRELTQRTKHSIGQGDGETTNALSDGVLGHITPKLTHLQSPLAPKLKTDSPCQIVVRGEANTRRRDIRAVRAHLSFRR